MHFTPTSSSWLNLVERFFAELTEEVVREGSFKSVPELLAAVEDYLLKRNQNAKTLSLACQGTRNFGQARARQESGCRSFKLTQILSAPWKERALPVGGS
jgi:hypothetical protein